MQVEKHYMFATESAHAIPYYFKICHPDFYKFIIYDDELFL